MNPASENPNNKKPVSERRLAANRANARKSTGPRTEIGKIRSSHNSFKHGLRSSRFLLSLEDAPAWERLLSIYATRFQPQDPFEWTLVERMARAVWNLDRLHIAENESLDDEIEWLQDHEDSFDDRSDEYVTMRAYLRHANFSLATEIHRAYGRYSREHDRAYKLLMDSRKQFPLAPSAGGPEQRKRKPKNEQTNPTEKPAGPVQPQREEPLAALPHQPAAVRTNPTNPTLAPQHAASAAPPFAPDCAHRNLLQRLQPVEVFRAAAAAVPASTILCNRTNSSTKSQ